MHRITVEVCSRTFAYPADCPCCGSDPDSELSIHCKASKRTIAEDTAREILFPYCASCVEHVRVWEAGSMASALILLSGIGAGIALWLSQGSLAGLVVVGAALAVAVFVTSIIQSRARARCLPACASGGPAVIFYGWSGSSNTFAFESVTYTARFAEQNASSLVSVESRLLHLLEAHEVARRQVPTPAGATRMVPPPRALEQWLSTVEHARTRVARRIELRRALDVLVDREERDALVHVTAHAELRPLFDRLEGCSTAARRRELGRALAHARADNVPAELREAKVRELERRIRSMVPS